MPAAKKKTSEVLPFSEGRKWLQKQYKDEAFEDAEGLELESTGSLALDWVLGGGLAPGRIYEFFGSEGSGKTTAALTAASAVQRGGQGVLYVDFEHALDTDYAHDTLKVSMDKDRWMMIQPTTAEAGLDMALAMIQKFGARLVIVDSVAAMVPKAEFEEDIGTLQVGLHGRVMSKALRKFASIAHHAHASVIFINQVREKIGVRFGDPTTTPGGKALKFYSSGRIKMSRIKSLDDGIRVKAQVKKSKITSSQKRQAEFVIRFGLGIDPAEELLTLGVECGVVTKPSTVSHQFPRITKPIPKGEKAARAFLRKNEKYAELLRKVVLATMLENEASDFEFTPETEDNSPLFNIDQDLSEYGSLDEMPDADVCTKASEAMGVIKESEAAVDTEDIEADGIEAEMEMTDVD